MVINDGRRLFNTFIKIFIVLLVIVIILPFVVDHIMDLFSGGMAPRSNSIIVFKDLLGEQAAINKFLLILKKIIIFM